MYLRSIPRIARLILAFIVLLVVLAVAAIGTLFYMLDEKAVRQTIDAYAKEALNASVQYAGDIKLKHLTALHVEIPALTFTDLDSGEVVGSIDSASAEVALWPALLGAVSVNTITIDGAQFKLNVPRANGDALFEDAFGSVRFPENLRVAQFKLTRAAIDLTTGEEEHARSWKVSGITLTTGQFSPEMNTSFEVSAHFEAANAAASEEAASPLPAATPSEPADAAQGAASNPAPEPAPVEEPAAAEPAAPTAPEAAPEPQSEPAQDAAAAGAPAPENSQDAQKAPESPAQPAEEPAAEPAQTPAGTPASNPNYLPAEPAAVTPAAPATEAADEAPAPAAGPAPESETPAAEAPQTMPAPSEPASPAMPLEAGETSAWNIEFIRSAHAQDTVTDAAAPFLTFDPSALAGDISAKGTLTLSVTDRYLMVEDVNFSGEVSNKGDAWTTVAKADRIRFKGSELTGSNLTASLSRPDDTTGDIHLGAVDFRLRPGTLESPEMRISRTEERGARVSTVEAASSVRINFKKKAAEFDNLTASVLIKGDPALPGDFSASVSGFIKADMKQNTAQAGLSGNFAGAPISFNGVVSGTYAAPQFEGELMIGEINRDTLPADDLLAWMRHLDFTGSVRIGRIAAGGLSGTQLSGTLTVTRGKALIDSLVINTADGRLFGTFEFSDDTSWLFTGRVDGVALDKLIAPVAGASPVAGVANGELTVSGKGFAPENLSGASTLRVLRPSYIGLDAAAVRSHLVRNTDTALITKQGARTGLDEGALAVTINSNTLLIKDIRVRSAMLRAKGEASLDLAAGTLTGDAALTFSPQQGVPSIHLNAQLSGKSAAPSWAFDWQTASNALRRAQGNTVEPAKPKEKSIWQSVKDFFSF